jgi:hypothetical protein
VEIRGIRCAEREATSAWYPSGRSPLDFLRLERRSEVGAVRPEWAVGRGCLQPAARLRYSPFQSFGAAAVGLSRGRPPGGVLRRSGSAVQRRSKGGLGAAQVDRRADANINHTLMGH